MFFALPLETYKSYLKLRKSDQQTEVFDPIRRKYVQLGAEELVRQLLVQYFMRECGVSKHRIQVERGIVVNGLYRRYDIAVFDDFIQPALLVECKSHANRLDQAVLDQVARYNLQMKVPYLVVSNGLQTCCARLDHQRSTFEYLPDIPHYSTYSSGKSPT